MAFFITTNQRNVLIIEIHLEQAVHGGPPWTALKPEKQWSFVGVTLGRKEPEEHVGVVSLVDSEKTSKAVLTLQHALDGSMLGRLGVVPILDVRGKGEGLTHFGVALKVFFYTVWVECDAETW